MANPASVPQPVFCTVHLRVLVPPTATSPKSSLLGDTAITGLVLSALGAAADLASA
jgi:hypothetical protein